MYKINSNISYIEKNGIFAVYGNYNLYFFKDISAKLFKMVIENRYSTVPNDFREYLIKKQILSKES